MEWTNTLILDLYRSARELPAAAFDVRARTLVDPDSSEAPLVAAHLVEARMINNLLWQHEPESESCDSGDCANQLTGAERRAASMIARGLSYKETAARLNISQSTVRNQLHSTYQKLGVRNKAALWLVLNAAQGR